MENVQKHYWLYNLIWIKSLKICPYCCKDRCVNYHFLIQIWDRENVNQKQISTTIFASWMFVCLCHYKSCHIWETGWLSGHKFKKKLKIGHLPVQKKMCIYLSLCGFRLFPYLPRLFIEAKGEATSASLKKIEGFYRNNLNFIKNFFSNIII